MAVANIEDLNGRPAIKVDGISFPPMMATICTTKVL